MSAALSIVAKQAAIRPEQFWAAVDSRLEAEGRPGALWYDELADLYRAGLSVGHAVRIVVARRRVRS